MYHPIETILDTPVMLVRPVKTSAWRAALNVKEFFDFLEAHPAGIINIRTAAFFHEGFARDLRSFVHAAPREHRGSSREFVFISASDMDRDWDQEPIEFTIAAEDLSRSRSQGGATLSPLQPLCDRGLLSGNAANATMARLARELVLEGGRTIMVSPAEGGVRVNVE